jgi:hypothetical protein
MTVVGAVTIVAALSLLTVSALSAFDRDDRETVGLGIEESGDDGTAPIRPRPRPTTSTTTTTTPAEAPEVLGDVTTREGEGPAPTTTAAADPTPSATGAPVPPAPAPTSAPTPPATAAPTTAPPPTAPPTTVCRNSTDPGCGEFRWDPEPDAGAVEVEVVSVPRRAVVGQPTTFAVDVIERAGADAIGACASWATDDPGVPSVSTCEAVNHSCDRYGPHDPPAARSDRVRVSRTISFTAPGEYRVTVGGHTATHLADGCASPYLDSWSRSFVVVVEASDA